MQVFSLGLEHLPRDLANVKVVICGKYINLNKITKI